MKSIHHHIIRVPALLLILFSLHSCIKEQFDPDKLDRSLEFSPGVALPLGNVHYQLEKLLEDSAESKTVQIDDDGFITIVYSQELISFKAGEFITIPDVSFNSSVPNSSPLPIDLSLISDSYTIQDSTLISMDIDGPDYTEIDSILVDSMTLIITINSDHNLNGNLEITSAGIVKNGKILQISVPLEQENPLATNLEGYTIILSQNPQDVNQLEFKYTVTLNPSSGIIPAGGTILDINMQIEDTDYSSIFGYLGQYTINTDPQSVTIDFFDNIIQGTFHFAEPELKLSFDNSYGLPIQILLEDFAVITKDNTSVNITGSGVPSAANPLVMNYPGLSQVGESVKDSILLDVLNSNLFDALEQSPSSLTYGVQGMMNPYGNDHTNFITRDSEYKVRADLTLPIYGYADFMLMLDTLSFNFESFYSNPPEEIKRLAFRINATNSFPVNINIQGYFVDENFTVLDSLFSDINDEGRIITGATDTDGDGKADPYENDPIEIEFTREQIDNISESRYLVMHGRMNTTGFELKENVKIYTSYFLDAYIGIIGDLEVNTAEY